MAGTQLLQIAAELPAYQTTIANKLNDLQEQLGGGGFLDRITGAVGSLTEQISQPEEEVGQAGRSSSPVPVTIANDVGNPLGVVTTLLGTLTGPLATGAIVAIFLVFLLLGQSELLERFIRLVSRAGTADSQPRYTASSAPRPAEASARSRQMQVSCLPLSYPYRLTGGGRRSSWQAAMSRRRFDDNCHGGLAA